MSSTGYDPSKGVGKARATMADRGTQPSGDFGPGLTPIQQSQYDALVRKGMKPPDDDEKYCPKCRKVLPRSRFDENPGGISSDGLAKTCRKHHR
jgi:hypothetical protein